jgi:endonuclease YncB( thermonuclease family)
MKRFLLTIVLILYPFLHVFSYELKVIDGDTIILNGKKIRFSGIDTPESYYRGKKQICYNGILEVFCGDLSKKFLIEKIGNNEVSCIKEKKPDRYKRILAECFVNNQSLSRYLVRNGYAFDYAYYSKKKFAKDEEYAKNNKLGLWKIKFDYPWIWRKKVRENKI